MKESFRQSMAWLHTWAGLLIGWLLFMMFLTGTAAVFNDEITAWMRPELGRSVDSMRALDLAQARMEEVAGGAESWTITLPSSRYPATRIAWQQRSDTADTGSRTRREVLDSASGTAVVPRETRGGDLFHRLHYRFEFSQPVQRAWWISGAATMFMLVAMITGVIVHRRIFRDLFTFRPQASRQRSWLDAHLLLGVLLLPFHLAIAYSGLVPIMSTVMPWAIVANYGEGESALGQATNVGGARSAYSRERRTQPPRREAAGEPASIPSLKALAAEAHALFGAPLGSIAVRNPGDRNAIVEIVRRPGGELSNRPQRAYFDGLSGALLPTTDSTGTVTRFSAAMYGLHMARFADPLLRWAYFLAGLASTAMIGAGLMVWAVKRRRRYADRVPMGHRWVERLNVASLVGLPIAIASYFWANRLLPVETVDRAAVEVRVFFVAWMLTLAFVAIRPRERAWLEALSIAALSFGALPLLNAVTTDRHLGVSLAARDWLMAGFDLTMLAIGALFAWTAWLVARTSQRPSVSVHGEASHSHGRTLIQQPVNSRIALPPPE